ncbi:MAG: hypothetical protein M3Q07_04265, partial [Pseudobdellovibrionaceae bacterium]|nr:hypothetical protein [Pseudobdellovibrionaceae bacterium]
LWTPAREYWGPDDPEGFLQPVLPTPSVEKQASLATSLQVTALNKKGFVHRQRRQAEALSSEPLLLKEAARIYSPSQSFVALHKAQDALFLLHPQTSLSVRPTHDSWQFSFTGVRGMARLSTHEQDLQVDFRPADPQTAWDKHELHLNPGSDVYVKYDRDQLVVYIIKGKASYHIVPSRPLQSIRPEGLLLEWELKQVKRQPKAPFVLDIFAGQELQLTAASEFQYHIGLPHPESWQAPILRSSPQLSETMDSSQPLTQAMLEIRKNWLKIWTGHEGTSKDVLARRMEAGRWEEAYDLLKTLETDLEHQALQAICLYRLQQESHAEKKRATVDVTSFWADILKQESLRAQLRKSERDVKLPQKLRTDVIPAEEIYLLATYEQARGRWRSALDLWERWPESQSDALLQASYKEWQNNLDRKKPLSYHASVELGWSDNILHLPSGLAAPDDVGHRSSWLLRSSQRVPYLIERSETFSVHLEASFRFMVLQHTGLTDLQRFEPGLNLPLSIQLPWGQQTLALKPYVSRLIQGTGGLDQFGYELRWQIPDWSLSPTFSWSQEQNLDFAPTEEQRLDALSGEPVSAIDRSVRRNTLGVHAGPWEFLWQNWDYRYAGSQPDDRQRFLLRGQWQKEFPYDLQLGIQGSLHQDLFKGQRSSVTGLQMRLETAFLRWVRLHPTLAVEREMRQTGDSAYRFTETTWLGGLGYRW